ncbi:MAG: ABC transporter ATP-binding protein [Parasporobacterium sp.]|nr:ABC transporter ATP-binding protein [Parasporobacterium sp.]
MLDVIDLTVRYGSRTVVDRVSFTVSEGQWLMIAGPNGAGKSTILNAITQGAPYTGSILLQGTDIKKVNPRKRAAEVGVLTQNHFVGYDFTVEEVVELGRYSRKTGMFSGKTDEDRNCVEEALKLTGMDELRKQSVLTLSGGELQRTFLAQAFAQNPRILLLDEPTNHLDLLYQKQVFALISQWLKSPGRAVVSVVHDLSLVKAFGSDAVLMDRGRVIAAGKAEDTIVPANVNPVYRMDVGEWMQKMLSQWEVH